MPNSESAPGSLSFGLRSRSLLLTLAAAFLLGVVAVALDGWYAGKLRSEAMAEVRSRMAGHGAALTSAFAERSVLLEALAAMVEGTPGGAGDRFEEHAPDLFDAAEGVRALQLVADGRIRRSYPLEGNEGVLDLDLLAHPDPRVPAGLLRTLESGNISVTGPVDLVQGGRGVILRHTFGRPGDLGAPSAAVVLDLETLLADAGLPDDVGDLSVELTTAEGTTVYGEVFADTDEPARVRVALPEGAWVLRAAPRGGWTALTSPAVRPVQLASLGIVMLATVLVFMLVERDSRLAEAVRRRTVEQAETNRRLSAVAADLTAREEQLRAALDAGSVSIWSWDVRSDVVERSTTELGIRRDGGRLPRTIAGFLEHVHPDDRSGLAAALDDARTSGVFGHEYRLAAGDGTYLWVRAQGTAVGYDEDGVTRITGATADITRVKELEAELMHSGRLELIGRLAGGVAHDFNNLLTVMRVELELGMEDEDPGQLRTAAARALDATQHATLLTQQLLTFARRDLVRMTTFEWDEVCAEGAALVRRLLGDQVDLVVSLGAPGAEVHMDRAQALQIVTNLAVNARDAMPAGGTVTVSTRAVPDGSRVAPAASTGPAVVLEVSDIGEGIAPEAQPRVFEPFFTTKPAGQGTGLGLSTTYTIAREQGGDVVFRTSARGTTFMVVIPLPR